MNNRFSLRPAPPEAPRFPRRSPVQGISGFSLVEVVLAIGVVAFAFVTLFGLLPSGLTLFRKAMDVSVGAQIFQKIVDDARQTDFSTLTDSTNTASSTTPVSFRAPQVAKPTLRYFDEAGTEILPDTIGGPTGSSLSVAQKVKVVYYVSTRIVTATQLPESSQSPTATYSDRYLATVTAQIATNPGNVALSFDTTTQLFKTPLPNGVSVTTYTALVAKND